MPNDIFDDELLEKAVAKACEREYSEVLNRNKQISYRKKKKLKIRYLLVAILILALSCTTVLAVEPVRTKCIEIIEKLSEFTTSVSFNVQKKEETKEGEFKILKPGYIPGGYKQVSEFYIESVQDYNLIYVNEEGDSLSYTQRRAENWGAFTFMSDGEPAKEMKLNGYPLYLITDKVWGDTMIYVRDDYIFYVIGEEEPEVLMEILRSLKNTVIKNVK